MQLVPTVARYWPLANGSGRIIDKFARGIDLGTGERRAKTGAGFPLTVLADDLIGRHILLTGRFDHSIVQLLLDRTRPGDVLLDVGANIGYVSACFLNQVRDGRAICVEPQPGIVDLLRRNLEQFGRHEIHQVGLSDHNGEEGFHVNPTNRGNSGLRADGEIKVPIVEASGLLKSLDRLDLIKIDVEGHELPIFRSIEGELQRLKPRAILFEDQTGSIEIRSILKRCGYTVFGIKKTPFKTRLIENYSDSNDHLAARK